MFKTDFNDDSSQKIFQLRKEGNLVEAYNMSLRCYEQDITI